MDLSPGVRDYWDMVLAGYTALRSNERLLDFTPANQYRFLSFFIVASHVADHLIHGQPQLSKKQVNMYIDSSLPLRRCLDICDATKHYELTRPRPLTPSDVGTVRPTFEPGLATVVVDDSGPTLKPLEVTPHHYIRFQDGTRIDALDLATDVVLAWHAFGMPLVDRWFEPDGLLPGRGPIEPLI